MALLTSARNLQKGDLLVFTYPIVFYDEDDKPYVSLELFLAEYQKSILPKSTINGERVLGEKTTPRFITSTICGLLVIDKMDTGAWMYEGKGDRSTFFLEEGDILGKIVGAVDTDDPYACLRILRDVAQGANSKLRQLVEDFFWTKVLE